MFRKMYDSLSMPVHTELLVQDDCVCLKTWVRIMEDVYRMDTDTSLDSGVSRSLRIGHNTSYMNLPITTQGVYHTKLPAGRFSGGTKIRGEEFLPNIPVAIRDTYITSLSGTYWQCSSYSWIDPSDPSIQGGELSDAACWTIGIGATMIHGDCQNMEMHHYPTYPSHNALAISRDTKGHPLRESRRYGSPVSLFVYQPFIDTAFTDCSITMKYNRGTGFSTNVGDWITDKTNYNYLGHLKEALPSFEIISGGGSIDADGYDTVEFKMVDSSGATINHATEVYLENTGGYLPKQRIDITDGTGSFNVSALGLYSGDTFKVKIGFRNYTGIADVKYIVV